MVKKEVVRYEEFGAKGDGKTDDFDALIKAHNHANEHGLSVKAEDNATYYLGPQAKTIIIQTDTDFGKAKFIIDDRKVENPGQAAFKVTSVLTQVTLDGVTSLKKNQMRLDADLPGPCLITVKESNVLRYIRHGGNQNKGKAQTDVFLVDKDGNVDKNSPIIWDFDTITYIKALPVDSKTLVVRGGEFTTIVDTVVSTRYQARNFQIRRSNVNVVGMQHFIKGEGDDGAPYGGFMNVSECADVTVRDCVFTGHKTFWKIGSAGRRVPMGTYDIMVNRAINVSFINCKQSNDIKDGKYWGIMASNYSKNIVYDGCVLSRFDAHMGVYNATIRNTTIGHAGINAIGQGTLLVENTTVHGGYLVNMRPDYGSTWQGEFIIRNCVFSSKRKGAVALIGGRNHGSHDFGYTCYMPRKITISKLKIKDGDQPEGYKGPTIFADFNPRFTGKEQHSIVLPEEVVLKDVSTASGKQLRVSDNGKMFKSVKIK